MKQVTLAGSPDVEVLLRRSARARRLSLRVSQLDGRITLTLPARAPLREAVAFVQKKESWIRQILSDRPATIRPMIGGYIMWQGREIPLRAGRGRSVRLEDDALLVPVDPRTQSRRVMAFLKYEARAQLVQASDYFAARSGVRIGRISLRDTRSRWGSCSSQGDLMYSWRLIMAPPEVLRYVAAHEVAHLQEMNHSPAYWRVLHSLFPTYAPARAWLRDNGVLLHRYCFSD